MVTEAVTYDPHVESRTHTTKDVPIVKTETRTVTYTNEEASQEDPGVLVSAQSHTSRAQTIETTTVRWLSPAPPPPLSSHALTYTQA